MKGSIGAVVVRWGGGEEVERCLRSLSDHGGPRLGKVVLVDSGSADGGAERLAALFPEVQVLALAENRSFAWAAGQGAAAVADHPLLLLLNPDTELPPGCVETLAGFLAERPTAAAAVPLLEHPDRTSQQLWQLRRLPSPWRLAGGLPGRPLRTVRPPTAPFEVEQPAAAAWLLRREVWDALDGLDPAFEPAWWEDVDFCARLADRLGEPGFVAREGFWLVPGARVVHHGGSSVARLSDAEFLGHYHRNLLRYTNRHHPRTAWAISIGLRATLAAKAMLRPRRRAAYLAALRGLR